jgi:hypothetical protein
MSDSRMHRRRALAGAGLAVWAAQGLGRSRAAAQDGPARPAGPGGAPAPAQGTSAGATGGLGRKKPLVGVQVGAVSFVDEGVDQVLDNLVQKGAVDTIFLATFSYGRGIAGRQVPGQPFPDHGKQEPDTDFRGGNFARPHPAFYRKTVLRDTRARDHGDLDILAEVLPRARARGLKVYCWNEDVFRADIPGVGALLETDLAGRRAESTLCAFNPDYRAFVLGLCEDHAASYPIDGLMWGTERQGPLGNALRSRHGGANADPTRVTCFCTYHEKQARARNIDPGRAREGYRKLADLVQRAMAGARPPDGVFVTFWRLLLNYPEILAWEKMYTDGLQSLYGEIRTVVKRRRPQAEVGFHIWHNNSFSPFYRAELDYPQLARNADFLKVVVYNNCGGPRYARYIDTMASTLFRDIPRDDVLRFHDHVLGYSDNDLAKLRSGGLPANYVAGETLRALAGVQGRCRIYPGIDIDIPTEEGEKKTGPDDVFQSVTAALKAGADGLVLSRKYSEMRLANLAAAGKAIRGWVG